MENALRLIGHTFALLFVGILFGLIVGLRAYPNTEHVATGTQCAN